MDSPERRNRDVNDAATEVLGASSLTLNTPQGFEELYRNTFPRVYAYVASLLRDRSAAEDVTALAFERAYRKRSRFSARRGSPEAWVFGIARNAALDELRKLKRRARLETEPADVWSPGPDEEAERAFRREEVRAALASLDPRDRDLVALKFDGGLSNGEIARVLGISETNVGSRLFRSVEKLRKACQS
ncbi:MAG TPA: RNA polymerase sigma factor [Thermoleophilaceae bacterium]